MNLGGAESSFMWLNTTQALTSDQHLYTMCIKSSLEWLMTTSVHLVAFTPGFT